VAIQTQLVYSIGDKYTGIGDGLGGHVLQSKYNFYAGQTGEIIIEAVRCSVTVLFIRLSSKHLWSNLWR